MTTNAAELPTYVTKADSDQVVVEVHRAGDATRLAALGFSPLPSRHEYSIRVADDAAKARVFAALRDGDVPFARGREWSPAELFEWFRDRKLVSGSFRSIAWRGPDQWIVRQEA